MELTVERLTKQYGNKIAVDRMSIQWKEGVYGLLGANGAGKTTLMRMICGILKPTSGEVKVDGQNNMDMGEAFRDMIGYLPQDFGYYPDFTAREFMHYIASLKGLPKANARERTEELLELVDLKESAGKKIKTFSGGMKQRLGIAQAVLNEPKILVLDEPTAGLDPKERVRFRNIISNFANEKIVILSTHIVSDVEYIAKRILMMKKGSLILDGTVEELTKKVKGKVWLCEVREEEAARMSAQYLVANINHNGSNAVLRIISDEKPVKEAIEAEGNLEDLYLYCFQDVIEEERGK